MPYHNEYLDQYRYSLLLVVILLFVCPLFILTNSNSFAKINVLSEAENYYNKKYGPDGIKEIKSILIELNYLGKTEKNSKFNEKMYFAIIKFQNKHQNNYSPSLSVDGRAGKKTKNAMEKALDKKKKFDKENTQKKEKIEGKNTEKPEQTEAPSPPNIIDLGGKAGATAKQEDEKGKKIILIIIISIIISLFVFLMLILYRKKIKTYLSILRNKKKNNQEIKNDTIDDNGALPNEDKNKIIENTEKIPLTISELENKIIEVKNTIEQYNEKSSQSIENGFIFFWQEINHKLKEISNSIKLESHIRNIIWAQAQQYFQKDYYNEESFTPLRPFQDIIKGLVNIAEITKEILNNQEATTNSFSGLEETLKAIPNYLKQFEEEELLGFIVSNYTKPHYQEDKREEFLFKEYPINKSTIKKLFNDKEFLNSNYEKLHNDLIFTIFGPFFCKMAEIQKENKNKLNLQQLDRLKGEISNFIEKHFKLEPMQIILGDKYDMNKHEIAGFSKGITADQESIKKKAIVFIYRWGYESKDENKIIKAKVAIR